MTRSHILWCFCVSALVSEAFDSNKLDSKHVVKRTKAKEHIDFELAIFDNEAPDSTWTQGDHIGAGNICVASIESTQSIVVFSAFKLLVDR